MYSVLVSYCYMIMVVQPHLHIFIIHFTLKLKPLINTYWIQSSMGIDFMLPQPLDLSREQRIQEGKEPCGKR